MSAIHFAHKRCRCNLNRVLHGGSHNKAAHSSHGEDGSAAAFCVLRLPVPGNQPARSNLANVAPAVHVLVVVVVVVAAAAAAIKKYNK